jgi:cell division transport system permease protein
MRVRLLPYLFKQALSNILSNRVVHAIGLGTMVVSLLIFGTFLLLFVNLNAWVQGWGHSMSMSVYLNDDISVAQRAKIASFIGNLAEAEIKRFISKDAALKDLRSALGSQAGVLEGLSDNPIPASFEVAFTDMHGRGTDLKGIKQALQDMDGVEGSSTVKNGCTGLRP